MIAQPARRVTDAEILVGRAHVVALIGDTLEMDRATWPGEGARAEIERSRAARRIAFARWLVRQGGLNEQQEATDVQA